MYSWVFRHRARLGIIYGLLPATTSPAAVPAAIPGAAPRTSRGPGGSNPAKYSLAPGNWVRRSRYVVLRPMRQNIG